MPGAIPEVGSAANRYEILAKLAEGGMAEIFLARGATEAGIERYVVLKRILRERAGDTALVRMFLDEAQLAAQLQHPNIAQVYDVGRLGESYFFTMEYVHGETVRALIKRSIATGLGTPIACALAVAAGAAAGLHHAHERKGPRGQLGIVHRDVSPSNLMVTYEGHVKVVDFGVAKASNRASQTHSGTVKGKIAYLSPEQCENREVDRRSDLFSLGIVLWELLVGEYLYHRDSDFLAMSAIVNEQPKPPSTLRSDIPPELDALVMRLLAKDPRARFQTASEVVEAVETLAARGGFALTPSGVARFMREWFGERPEPWLDLGAAGSRRTLTVNSAPIPDQLIAPHTQLDDELGRVPTLPPTELEIDELKATLIMGAQPRVTQMTVAARPTRPRDVDASVSVEQPSVQRRSRVPFVLAALAAFALGVVIVLAVTRDQGQTPPIGRDAGVAVHAAVHAAVPAIVPADAAPAPDASAVIQRDAAVEEVVAPADAATAPVVEHVRKRPPASKPHAAPSDAAAVDECASDPMACQR